MDYRKIILALAAVCMFAGCQRENVFESLAVDNEDIYVSRKEGSTLVVVYGSNSFDVSLASDVDWLRVGEITFGRDRGSVRLYFDENPSIAREANVKISSGADSKLIRIMQNASSSVPSLTLVKKEFTLPAGHYSSKVGVKASRMEEVSSALKISSDAEWVSGMSLDLEEGCLHFDVAQNASGQAREAAVSISLVDAKGTLVIDQTLQITQDGSNAYISLPSYEIQTSAGAASSSLVLETNLGDFADSVAVTCEYDGQQKDWISAEIVQGQLSLSVTANSLPQLRGASVMLSSVDADGNKCTMPQVLSILQGFFWEMSVAQLKQTVGDSDYNFEPGLNSYALKAVVVSDGGSENNAFNPNTNFQTVDTKASKRVAYVQNEDAACGMKLCFTSAVDTLRRGDIVVLTLSGKTVKVHHNPRYYYIEGLIDDDIVSRTDAFSAPVFNTKSIGQLSENDLFTAVSLKDVEFVFKKGAYTNVQEAYAQNSALNEGVKSRAHVGDSPVRLLQDRSGAAVYMAVNTLCQWRRALSASSNQLAGVPQGVGDVNGVLVYEQNPRYGYSNAEAVTGNVGDYVIRPLYEDDIRISRESASARRVIAQWVFDHKVTWIHMYDPNYVYNKGNVGTPVEYKWNPEFKQGKITSGTSTFVENPMNRMLATSGSDTDALFYCDNMTGIVDKVNTKYNTSSTADGHIYSQLAYFRPIMVDGFNSEYVWDGDDLSVEGLWRYSLDDLKPWWTGSQAHNAGKSAYSNYMWPCNLSGWYDWENGGSEATGFVVKASTAGASGTLVLSFDVSAGGRGAINWSQYMSNSDNVFNSVSGYYSQNFPLYWKVQYSTDGGSSWTDGAVDAVTGLGEFQMHAGPFWSGDAYLDPSSASKSGTHYCNNQTSLGNCEYSFVLPDGAKGHSEVLIRITPASRVLATATTAQDLYARNVNAGVMATKDSSFGNMIRFGGISLQCE